MFLLRYFKYSFGFKTLFDHVHEKGWKILIYFFILSMIAIFPSNYQIVKDQGWRLDFIEESFIAETPNWELPNDCVIIGGQLSCNSTNEFVLEHRGITYIFNALENERTITGKTLLFYSNRIVYINENGNEMTGMNYQGFVDVVNFREINLMSGQDKVDAYIAFGTQVEQSFGPYIVFYSLLINTLTTIGTYILYLLLLGLILQLFRFGYSKFMTYIESLKFLVLLMGVPAIIGFMVGLIEPAFGAVLFQFSMGIIAMLIMLFYGKKYFA